jgi:RNA recognition motif-containing protein
MAKKLYVGNLPYNTSEDDLRDLFSPIGEISDIALITDRYTGQSKGFAFVEMPNDDAAADAISRLNGYTLGARQIVVNEARPREDRPGGGGRGGGRGGYDRRDNDRGGGRGRY